MWGLPRGVEGLIKGDNDTSMGEEEEANKYNSNRMESCDKEDLELDEVC